MGMQLVAPNLCGTRIQNQALKTRTFFTCKYFGISLTTLVLDHIMPIIKSRRYNEGCAKQLLEIQISQSACELQASVDSRFKNLKLLMYRCPNFIVSIIS